MKIVNVSKRKFIIDDGQGSKDLAPLKEMEVKEEIAKSLVASFHGEIKIVEEKIIEEPKKEVIEPVAPMVAHVHKPKKGNK